MPGYTCPNPNCGKRTLHAVTGHKKICSSCKMEVTQPPNAGKGGKGEYCVNCKRNTIFNGKCTVSTCGTKYKFPKPAAEPKKAVSKKSAGK